MNRCNRYLETKPLTTYALGYRAHVDGKPRCIAPHEDREWLRGWDAAERDKTRGREILAAQGTEVWRPSGGEMTWRS